MKAIIGYAGTGKTTILKELAKKGYSVFNCDKWIHEQYNTDSIIKSELIKELGNEIIVNNKVDRDILKNLIKKNNNILNLIEKITHPHLLKQIKNNKYDFVEIPILEYSPIDFTYLFDGIIKLTRNINSENWINKIIKPIRKINYIEIKNNNISDAVEEILSNCVF
ncbi:MAG: dephospho-CoA kinase [Mycoplasma sp.]|nr:dephospho-CoA kinase [Mycoplasma sp.]